MLRGTGEHCGIYLIWEPAYHVLLLGSGKTGGKTKLTAAQCFCIDSSLSFLSPYILRLSLYITTLHACLHFVCLFSHFQLFPRLYCVQIRCHTPAVNPQMQSWALGVSATEVILYFLLPTSHYQSNRLLYPHTSINLTTLKYLERDDRTFSPHSSMFCHSNAFHGACATARSFEKGRTCRSACSHVCSIGLWRLWLCVTRGFLLWISRRTPSELSIPGPITPMLHRPCATTLNSERLTPNINSRALDRQTTPRRPLGPSRTLRG